MIAAERIAPEVGDVASTNKVSNVNAVQATDFRTDSFSSSMTQIGAKNEQSHRKYDAAKVARLKAQIACGEYEINPSRIASKMIEDRT